MGLTGMLSIQMYGSDQLMIQEYDLKDSMKRTISIGKE